jgi:hypothetical protein
MTRILCMKKLLTSLLTFVLISQSISAFTRTWIGNNTNWNDPGNWSPAGVPLKNDSVFINAGMTIYPMLTGSFEIFSHSSSGPVNTMYTCSYLFLANGATLDFGNTVTSMLIASNADIHGTITIPKGTVICEEHAEEVPGIYHANFSGATIKTAFYESGVTICGFDDPIDNYLNCYVEGQITLNSAFFGNCTLAGSVWFDNSHHPNLSGCTIRLMEKYGGFLRRSYVLSGCVNSVISDFSADVVNDTPDDDTLFIFSNSFAGPANVRDFYGNININTNNDCARIKIGGTHYNYSSTIPCPPFFTSIDSMTLHGNLTVQNKAVIELAAPVLITGTITLNHGHLIKTYPCAVNVFPPGDTLNCPINFNSAYLDFSGGKLVLIGNMVANRLLNYDETHYLVTSPGGSLTRSVMNSYGNVVFPIGTNTDYTPLFIADTSLSLIDYTATVSPGVYSNGNSGPLFASKVVDRTWNITKVTSLNSSATLTLQWNLADELPDFTRNLCGLSHFSGNSWHTGPYSLSSGSGPFQQSWSGLNSFSPYAVGSSGILALGCMDFTAFKKDNAIHIQWTCGQDSNNLNYILQRSLDGMHFDDIYTALPGSSITANHYTYQDYNYSNGNNFYRIQSTNAGGNKIQVCPIVKVVASRPDLVFSLVNNPLNSWLRLKANSQFSTAIRAQIYDMQGRQVSSTIYKVMIGTTYFDYPTSLLPAGIYFLRLTGDGLNKSIFFNRLP